MKTIKYLLFAFIAPFVLAGCSDDIKYTPGEGEDPDCYGVYFPSQEYATDNERDPAEPTTLPFTAKRKNYKDAITVPVEVTGTQDGIFTVSEIKFEAGQEETEFTVDFPNAEIGKTYECSIRVTDKKYAQLYGEYSNGLDFSVTRVQWNLVKGPNGETKGTWRDDFFTAIMGSNIKENGVPNAEKAVEIYERADMKGYYRIQNIYDEAYMAKIVGVRYSNVPSVPTYTIIDARDPEKVWFPVQPTGFEINDVGYEDNGAFVIVSFCQENYPTMASATMYGTLENGVLTFPPKAILLTTPSLWEATSYFKANTEMTRLLFPGAVSYDYSVAFEKSAPADGKVAITATLGSDVDKVKYAFFEGALSESLAAAKSGDIDAGTPPSEEITASGTITAVMEKTGIYTIVGNSYDEKGNLQKYGYVSFGYVKAGEEKPVVMSVRTELTWEKESEGHTPENSIKGILFGEEIASGYIGLFTTASTQGMNESQLIAGVKASGKALTAEQLEKINDTGYAPFYVGLSKGTSYTLLVYADNGYNGKLFAVEQTTAGKADPLQRKYTIDDLYTFSNKAQLFKTWDLWGINNDGSGKTNRSKIGQVVFSENETDDTSNLDAINVAGLSLGANNEDTVVWEWYNGIIYVLKGQPMGTIPYQGATLYLKYYILDKETSMGADTIDGMMVGGVTEDGYLALICSPDFSDKYNFDTILVRAYTDANYTNSIGNWESYTSPLMVPATGGNTGAAAPRKVASDKMLTLSKEISINPSNYVELRGRERAHALIDELFGKPVNRGANPLEGEVSVRIATPAMSSFSEGFVPRANSLQSGGMEKMPLKKMAK